MREISLCNIEMPEALSWVLFLAKRCPKFLDSNYSIDWNQETHRIGAIRIPKELDTSLFEERLEMAHGEKTKGM